MKWHNEEGAIDMDEAITAQGFCRNILMYSSVQTSTSHRRIRAER
jgi:hypothetical protein